MKIKTAAAVLAIGTAMLGSGAWAETVGISMPTKSSARWISDGN